MAGFRKVMATSLISAIDSRIKEIIGTPALVALYTFNVEAKKWELADIEGTLFVYSRTSHPYYCILVANRLGENNLIEPILSSLELHLEAPYLLYRNALGRIFGIWFGVKEECIRIASVLDQLIKESASTKQDHRIGILDEVQDGYN